MERTRQVLATGAESVATACPFCMVTMTDGLKDAANTGAGVASARDIAEILAPTFVPAFAGGRRLPGPAGGVPQAARMPLSPFQPAESSTATS